MNDARFPEGFVWGAATSAYQIEGAVTSGGRGPSIWDTFCRVPGAVVGGDTGDVACDHYRRYADDVALMAGMGLQAYRFSVAWPRVIPAGTGATNRVGLDFYDRLVDALLGHGIDPVLTLYHWDLPQPLQDAGGWGERATAEHLAEYAAVVAHRLGDRVRRWTTLNEPWCAAFLGYASGVHAPGIRDQALSLRAAHNLLLAHGLATRALRAELPAGAEISIALNVHQFDPASEAAQDVEAARRLDGIANRLFLDPLFHGGYPEDVLASTARLTDWSFVEDGDLKVIGEPLDALGVNYYTPASVTVRSRQAHALDPAEAAIGGLEPYPGCEDLWMVSQPGERTGMGWLVEPSGLTRLLLRLAADVPGVPLLVTENGAAYDEPGTGGTADGALEDRRRIDYLDRHLRAAHEAISQGVDLRAYFVWSLLDNFEWSWGYSQRFGVVHVDFTTGRRTPKRSAEWLRSVIGANGLASGGTDVTR